MILKGRRFQTAEDIIMNRTNKVRVIVHTPFKQCFQKWKSDGSSAFLFKEITLTGINVTMPEVLK